MRILSEFVNKETKILTVEIGKNEEIEVKRKKRSNKANAYFWEMLQQLCYEMNIDVIQEYRKRVRELGVFRQWDIEETNLSTFEKIWAEKGLAWFTEVIDTYIKDQTVWKKVNAYYGSSSYNSKQFSKLVDNLVQDCRSIGIQTLEDIEIEELIRSNYE